MGVRQNPMPNSAVKLLEAYMDFSGGHVSEISNEKLKDNEYPILENADLSGRSSAKIRYGRDEIFPSYPYDADVSKAQGLFFYYRAGASSPDMVLAVSGYLYIKNYDSTSLVKVPIVDGGNNNFQFQATQSVDAVQYKGDMFIATGTKLCELTWTGSAWSAKTTTPYTITSMEAIYIGTNGLADNPNAYVQDGTGVSLAVVGIQPDKRKGNVNQNTVFTAFVTKTSTGQALDYKWEYKQTSSTTWITGRDWTADTASGKTWTYMPDTITPYDVKVTIRQTGTTTPTATLTLQAYEVYPTENKQLNQPLSTSGIQRCRRIVLHWDRILLAQDDTNPYQMYISDLANPRYFPTSNTIPFDTGKQEPITAVVKYRGLLVIFTRSTIQTLSGKDVGSYSRNLVHDSIGCIASNSAKVVGNNIVFLSSEGIMMIKPNQLILESMNVQRVDYPIKSEVPKDMDACGVTSDGQFFMCFPSSKKIFRLYYDAGMWVRDSSSKLNIAQFAVFGETVYNLTTTGRVYKHNKDLFTDCGEAYTMVVESKFLDLSASFNYKRLKKLHVLAKHYPDHTVSIYTTVQADSTIVLTPEVGQAVTDPVTNTTTWYKTITPNMEFQQGTQLGAWVLGEGMLGDISLTDQKASIRGRCRRVKVRFEYSGGKACEIYGFGLEFKLKKP